MRRFALSLAASIVLCPTISWAQDSGADAFANRDFPAAQELWLQEAAAGSAEAMLGLGLLADRGFNGKRDLSAAFAWYSRAADLGLAEAQFNIAIMYDAGLGRERDAEQALTWYTRAALRGHGRAQYNLGLLFENGEGVAENPDLAAYWFKKAAQSVPAAAEKSLTAGDATDFLAAPNLSFAQDSAQGAELVWHVGPAASQDYLVEVLAQPIFGQDYAPPLLSRVTGGSGLLEADISLTGNTLWRVSNVSSDGTDYEASDWIGADDAQFPDGRITILFDAGLPAMAQAAAIFSDDLRQAGYWVRLDQEGPAKFDDPYISYGFATDQLFAENVAGYLPGLQTPTPIKQVRNRTQPGEIIINLAAFRPF